MAKRSRRRGARVDSRSEGRSASAVGGEFQSGPVAGIAHISAATFTGKALKYADVDGVAMFEGDIVLGTIAYPVSAAGPLRPVTVRVVKI
jgi:hypothetical protein